MNTKLNMKKSLYNHLSYIDGRWILYNAFSDEICVLDPQIKALYEGESIEKLRCIHPEFYDFLVLKGFIVPFEVNEAQKCIKQWEREDNDQQSFTLMVNPTLDCNMRCWYCYEKHNATRTMIPEVLDRLKTFISQKMESIELQVFNLSFFGGEPFMQYHSIVKPLIEYTHSLAIQAEKTLNLQFTTNGYKLESDFFELLSVLNVHSHFQITLDGNKRMHDIVRNPTMGGGSYNTILSNCAKLLAIPGVDITIRCNYTTKNVATFVELAEDLKSSGILPTPSLGINFHRVWQDYGNEVEVNNHIEKATKILSQSGYAVLDSNGVEKHRCYADRNNHIVINYDGNLFRCTARDFVSENAEGILNEDGTLSFNEKASIRKNTKWGNATCARCNVYPLCHGLCSQYKIEHAGVQDCIAGYSKEDKNNIFDKRIKYIIKQARRCL